MLFITPKSGTATLHVQCIFVMVHKLGNAEAMFPILVTKDFVGCFQAHYNKDFGKRVVQVTEVDGIV